MDISGKGTARVVKLDPEHRCCVQSLGRFVEVKQLTGKIEKKTGGKRNNAKKEGLRAGR